MPGKKIMGEYLYEIKPYVNKDAWRKASGEVRQQMSGGTISSEDFRRKQQDLMNDGAELSQYKRKIAELEKMRDSDKTSDEDKKRLTEMLGYKGDDDTPASGMYKELAKMEENFKQAGLETEAMGKMVKNTAGTKMSAFSSKLSAGMAAIQAYTEAMKKAINAAIDLADKATVQANKFNATGAFGSMATRDMMTRYGVSSSRANAMSNALNALGMSESDIGRMSAAQRKAYDELISYYEKGMNKIDLKKLKDYYKTIEEYQMTMAKFKIDTQQAILKLFANSKAFEKMTGSIGNLMEGVVDLMEEPAVQVFFDVFIGFLQGLVEFASWFLKIFGSGKDTSPNSSSTTNNNNQNTYYIYGSDYRSNDELARSIALQQSSGG